MSTSNKRLQNEAGLAPKMPKTFSIEQISVMINHQSINEIKDGQRELGHSLAENESMRAGHDASALIIAQLTQQVHKDVVI